MEEWRPVTIIGYEHLYHVSNLGRVKSLHKGERILKLHGLKDHYLKIQLHNNGKMKRMSVHRLVALAFVQDSRLALLEVDHINNTKTDNRAVNLRWVTRSQNMARRKKNKRHGKITGCSSQYKGVSWDKQHKCWQAYIRYDSKQHNLGLFKDEQEAAHAYDDAALEQHGEFANLNFEVQP